MSGGMAKCSGGDGFWWSWTLDGRAVTGEKRAAGVGTTAVSPPPSVDSFTKTPPWNPNAKDEFLRFFLSGLLRVFLIHKHLGRRETARKRICTNAQDAGQGTPIDEVIGNVLKANWDHERTKFALPPMMTLILGEPGTGGSSTPSMVGAVKKWQKSDPQNSCETWKKLSEANSTLEIHLNTLSKLAEINFDNYRSAIIKCSILTSEKWRDGVVEPNQIEVVKALLGARDAMLSIRCNMRAMGEAAGIPIEPESQTKLLDMTMNMEGVLLAGVPGAGGFDAVFAVTLGDSISSVVKVWSSLNVLALLVREDPRGVCLERNDPRAAEVTDAVSSIHIE